MIHLLHSWALLKGREGMRLHKDFSRMCVTILFVVTKIVYLQVNGWTNYHIAIECCITQQYMDTLLIYNTIWMSLKIIMLGKKGQAKKQKTTYYII